METRKSLTNYGKCRCCLTKGNHRDIMKEYYHNGIREVYFDIFLECFNLFLSTNTHMGSLICSTCVHRLRDASNFKMMVISAEQQLLEALDDGRTVFVNVPVSEETVNVEFDIKMENPTDFKGSGVDFGVQYVANESCKVTVENDVEAKNASKEHQTEVKREPGDMDQNDIDYDTDYVPQDICVSDRKTKTKGGGSLMVKEAALLARFPRGTLKLLPKRKTLYKTCAGYVKQLDLLKGKLIVPTMIAKLLEEAEHKRSLFNTKKVYVTEKLAHILNASTLLQFSNITPFKSKSRSGFPCFYCRNIFENLDRLREHQERDHRKTEIRKILSTYGAECLVVYVDVTDLKCTICDEALPNLNELKSHLTKVHKKKMHLEFTDRVIPFKLSQDHVYECQICGFNFETFGSIERHMNVHYRNYVCKECGTGFVTKYRLKVHVKSMHVGGSFPCEVCKNVYSTQQKHKNHVDTVHKLVKRFKCPKCPERFSEYFRRQKHMVQAHGVAPLQYRCNVCDKTFDRRYTLSRHMKRDHLGERDFQCLLCSYKCYTNNELRVHMVKHNGERIFECSVCKKSYARKKTLKEHMRIHNNDKRFACAVCGQAFVQKCSLKGHIKTHHLEYSLQ